MKRAALAVALVLAFASPAAADNINTGDQVVKTVQEGDDNNVAIDQGGGNAHAHGGAANVAVATGPVASPNVVAQDTSVLSSENRTQTVNSNQEIEQEDNSTNVDRSFNEDTTTVVSGRDNVSVGVSTVGGAKNLAGTGGSIVVVGKPAKATPAADTDTIVLRSKPRVYESAEFDLGKALPKTGASDDLRLAQALLALFAVISIAIGRELTWRGRINPLAI